MGNYIGGLLKEQSGELRSFKPSSQYNTDADVDADARIEMNPIPASASTSKDAACVKAVSLMLTLT